MNRGRRAIIVAVIVLGIVGLGFLIHAIIQDNANREKARLAFSKAARIDLTKTQIAILSRQLEKYNLNIGHYPTEAEGGLRALVEKPAFADPAMAANWAGPYDNSDQLKDPWKNPLHFKVLPPGTDVVPFKLWSNGPDGIDGTGDEIDNWSDKERD